MASKLTSLFYDPVYYSKSFKAFVFLSNRTSMFTSWIEDVFSQVVVAKIQNEFRDQKELRVLGVGSGSGETEVFMLSKLLQPFPRINNRVVEPAEDLLVKYKALVASKSHELQGVSYDWRQQTIEEYARAGNLESFHFISAVHSFYYVNDAESLLMYLYDRLEPGGIMLLILNSAESGFNRFRSHFSHFQDNKMHHISSATIQSCLNRRGIPSALYSEASAFDITQCFDENSKEGLLVLDFITHIQKFRESAPKELLNEVMEFLAGSDCSEKTSDGKVLFNVDWDAVVFGKPLE